MTDFDVDLFVIGAGSGGVRAARIAANHGARVTIAEEYRVGGTCVIRGCVPKKLLVYASRFAEEFHDAAGYGWTVGEPVFDWPTLIANKDLEIDRLERAYVSNLERSKVNIVRSRAVLEDAHRVRLVATGEIVRAKHILIATGGWPSHGADIAGLEHVISSNEALDLKALPKRILIQGGGYIAVEFASVFAALGVETTLIHRGGKVLRGFDEDLRDDVQEAMARRGVKFLMNDHVVAIEKTEAGKLVGTNCGATLEAGEVMMAIGRRPLTAGLGLESVGVEPDHKGAIAVDEYSRTSAPSIYAIGDVTNRMNLTPIAIREGHALADTLFGGRPTSIDYANVPTAVFTTPEIGTVGLSEEQARESGRAIDIYKTRFRPMKATLSGAEGRMLMKLVVDAQSDRVLGVHVLGEDAAEIVQVAAIAVKMGATKADFDATVALHPTASEELVTLRTKWTGA